MRKKLLEYICCPHCQGDLQIQATELETTEIVQGKVGCLACGREYRIEEGLLYLVPEDRLGYFAREDSAHRRALQETGFFGWVKGDIFYNWPHQLPDDAPFELQVENLSHSKSFLRVLDQVHGDETVLDFGAGFGWASRDFARKGCYVVALDISPYMLRKANEYLNHFQIYFERVVSDMQDLPFQGGIFDLVFGAAAIHHSCNLEKTIQELARVAKLHKRVTTIKDHLRPGYLSLEEWKEGDQDTSFGINENSFNYLDYTQAFLGSGLRPEIKVSKHYWSERSYATAVEQNAYRCLPVRLYLILEFWLSNYAIVDIFAQKVGTPRPWTWRAACALLRVFNHQGLFVQIFQLFAPRGRRYFEREKPFYLASVQAPSTRVDREMTYDVEIASNSTENCQVKLSFDIYPLTNPRHPDRHVGYWAKVFTLKSGERRHLRVKFRTGDLEAQFRLGSRYYAPDDVWRGNCFKSNRFYKVGFYLYDEQGCQIHQHILLQRFVA